MGNDQIIKCGVGIHHDVTKIFRDYGIRTRGVIELNDLLPNKKTKHRMLSLNALYQRVCCQKMKYKDQWIAQSDWNCFEHLSVAQIHYAADDALVGSHIFVKLMEDIHGCIDACDYRMKCAAFIDLKAIKAKK